MLHLQELTIYNFLPSVGLGQPVFTYFNLNSFSDCRIFKFSAGDEFQLADSLFNPVLDHKASSDSSFECSSPTKSTTSKQVLFVAISLLCYILQVNDLHGENWGIITKLLRFIDFDIFSNDGLYKGPPLNGKMISDCKKLKQVQELLQKYFGYLKKGYTKGFNSVSDFLREGFDFLRYIIEYLMDFFSSKIKGVYVYQLFGYLSPEELNEDTNRIVQGSFQDVVDFQQNYVHEVEIRFNEVFQLVHT